MGVNSKFRSAYDYDTEEASNSTSIAPGGPSLTVQSMTEDSDLNVILRRFKVTGQMPENIRLPSYGDFTGINDFQSALEALTQAQDNFMEIPAEIRARFENNPQLLLDFVSNPANISEAKKLFGESNVDSMGSNAKAPANAGAPSGDSTASGGGKPPGNADSGKPAAG